MIALPVLGCTKEYYVYVSKVIDIYVNKKSKYKHTDALHKNNNFKKYLTWELRLIISIKLIPKYYKIFLKSILIIYRYVHVV